MSVQNFHKRAMKLLLTVFLACGVLAATHLGEFWPFSIYPMFSQAGNPWLRSLVRDVTGLEKTKVMSQKFPEEDLPGEVFALDEIGINQNDVSNFLQKAGNWDEEKIRGMRTLFEDVLPEKDLLLMKVEGRLVGQQIDSVEISYTPFMLLTTDTTIVN